MIQRPLDLLPPVAAVAVVSLAVLLPYGAALAVLACVPILFASASDLRWQVPATAGTAALALVVTAGLALAQSGVAALPTEALLLVMLALVLAAALAARLQKRRLDAVAARDAAEAASETNHLLMSLLAHDLRAPLTLAEQALQYVEESVSGGYPVDPALVADVRARLQRSLRAIQMVLSLASARADADITIDADGPPVSLHEEIEAEMLSFGYEAEARDKWLVGELDAVHGVHARLDTLVLRQALAIVLDNAIRYADPGPIRVRAGVRDGTLQVAVSDSGPGLTAHRHHATRSGGSGLGLRLCGTLLARAGGNLDTSHDGPDGTTVLIRLPLTLAPAAAPAPPLLTAAGA
jgi:two-component system, OmpR family, sensor histidine kinase AdeS